MHVQLHMLLIIICTKFYRRLLSFGGAAQSDLWLNVNGMINVTVTLTLDLLIKIK